MLGIARKISKLLFRTKGEIMIAVSKQLDEAKAAKVQAYNDLGAAIAEGVAAGQPVDETLYDTYDRACRRAEQMEAGLEMAKKAVLAEEADKGAAIAKAKKAASDNALNHLAASGSRFDALVISLESAAAELAGAFADSYATGSEQVRADLAGVPLRISLIVNHRLRVFPAVKQVGPSFDATEISKFLPKVKE